MKRKDANLELINILKDLVEANPDQRFHQILRNYGFISEKSTGQGAPEWINEFYSEPEIVLKRVKEELSKRSA